MVSLIIGILVYFGINTATQIFGISLNYHPDFIDGIRFTELWEDHLGAKIFSLLTGATFLVDELFFLGGPASNMYYLFIHFITEPVQLDLGVILGLVGPVLSGVVVAIVIGTLTENSKQAF